MRLLVRSLALLSELRIWHCRELWCRLQTCLDLVWLWLWCRPAATAPIRLLAWESCRLQTRLGSGVAVAMAKPGSHSSDTTTNLGKTTKTTKDKRKDKKKKKKKKRKKRKEMYLCMSVYTHTRILSF